VLVKQIRDIEMKSMGQSFWEDLWLQVTKSSLLGQCVDEG
jgi:hypothetical protein